MGFTFERKINYYETDKMGVVHHSNYIRYMDDKLTHTSDFDVSQLKDSEVRNLAKLFGASFSIAFSTVA